MTTAERNIAQVLAGVKADSMKDMTFMLQLKNWRDRPMTRDGAARMMRLLEKYQRQIPDHATLRSAYINEQLKNLAP